MSLFNEGEWTRPYEKYTSKNMEDQLAVADFIEVLFDKDHTPEQLKEDFLSRLSVGNDTIFFDRPYINYGDIFRTGSGLLVHYPVRTPLSEEVGIRELGINKKEQTLVLGFGSMAVVRSGLQEEHLEKLAGESVYPFRLDLRVANKLFKSYPEVEFIEEGRSYTIGYWDWSPHSAEQPGEIFMPLELPVLMGMEFKLSRIDPMRAFRNITP